MSDPKQMPELLPCPFCGETPPPPIDATRIEGWWNIVHGCEVVNPIVVWSRERIGAIEVWNTRADLVPKVDVEGLVTAIIHSPVVDWDAPGMGSHFAEERARLRRVIAKYLEPSNE